MSAFDGTPRPAQHHCSVLGWPVAYSLSPAIHRAAYHWLGLDWTYDFHEVEPSQLAEFVLSRDATWRGLSITMPLKEPAVGLGIPDRDVTLTGVANTLIYQDDDRFVFNTDIPGFMDAVRAANVGPLTRAAIVGSGATATSALVALSRLGLSEVIVLARNGERVADLVEWSQGIGLRAMAGDWGAPLDRQCDLLISTIPSSGVDPVLDDLRLADATQLKAVFDVIYHPWPTALAGVAARLGLTVLNGLDLLVHQGVHQVKLMTGMDVAADVMMSGAMAEIRRRANS